MKHTQSETSLFFLIMFAMLTGLVIFFGSCSGARKDKRELDSLIQVEANHRIELRELYHDRDSLKKDVDSLRRVLETQN